MTKFSGVIAGLLVALAGSAIATFGLSDSCSSEILAKATPFLGMLPGVVWAWISRIGQGDVTVAGFRKDVSSS